MRHPFDPGYVTEPFLGLCADYPGVDVYPSSQFRVEWGPIFHRGRLNGSARVLVIGQDPAQHVKARTRRNPARVDYRDRWLDALLVDSQVEAVIALGTAADEAWKTWRATLAGQSVDVAYAAVTHPTQPESSSRNDRAKLTAATDRMLQNWNVALQSLSPHVLHPDVATPLVPYGDTWADGDRVGIPEADFPARLPAWMHEQDGWARRAGADDLAKRRNITVTVPKGVVS